jgi:hypothetical protein
VFTVRDVVNKAFRKLGVTRSGGVASGNDAADGLASLVALYNGWVTQGAFGRVRNVPITTEASVVAGPNQHINVLTEDAVTVELPSTMQYIPRWDYDPLGDYGFGAPFGYPWTESAFVNVPPDKTVVRITDQFGPSRAVYIYDGYVQLWMRIDELALGDEAPLSQRDADGLAAILAVRLSDEFGAELLTPGTVRAANRYQLALVTGHGNEDVRLVRYGDYY